MNQTSMNSTTATLEELLRQEMYKREPIEVHIPYVVTAEGEIIPFRRLRRLSVSQFRDEQGMFDTLAEDTVLPVTPLYAELENGQRCVLNIDDVDFQNCVNRNAHGVYMATDNLKQLVINQFAREYKYEATENNDREKITVKGTGEYPQRERG